MERKIHVRKLYQLIKLYQPSYINSLRLLAANKNVNLGDIFSSPTVKRTRNSTSPQISVRVTYEELLKSRFTYIRSSLDGIIVEVPFKTTRIQIFKRGFVLGHSFI